MQRSRSRKLARRAHATDVRPAEHRFAKLVRHASIGAAVMAAISAARAQTANTDNASLPAVSTQAQQVDAPSPNPAPAAANTASDQGGLQEVVVTASKQAVNIQNVPMTVTAVTGAALTNQDVQNFSDFAKEMPQLAFESAGTPGASCIIMRGISGCGSGVGQGSVAVYLDEQPITTPAGDTDWHMYDVSRIEVLPGPQGTLYGASSEAGTIRYITNKPNPDAFSASYTGQLNNIYNGTIGGLAEGFVNLPITSNIAARFVGWYERDSGYINNVAQTVTLANGFSENNAPYVQNHYNPVTTEGGRAMFTFKINDDWSINPTIATQKQRWDGTFGTENWKLFEASPGIASGLTVAQFSPDISSDSTLDYQLTVLGKVGNFNITFASAYTQRHYHTYLDYMDYTLAYQQYETRAQDYYPPTGGHTGCSSNVCLPHDPLIYKDSDAGYKTITNELRVASPTDWPVHFIAGLYQDHVGDTSYLFEPVVGLDPTYQVGYGTDFVWRNMVFLNDELLVWRDWAGFIQANWDITSHLTATAGFRRYRYDNSIFGFTGYSTAYAENVFGAPGGVEGEETCISSYSFRNAPCTDLYQTSEAWGSVPLFTLSYKFDPDHMLYVTFSKGYRPGGPNHNEGAPPFLSDFLTNYEAGVKSAWFEHHVIFNADVYYDVWKDYQFNFTGAQGIPITANAGSAASKGFETQLQWLVTTGLNLTANLAYTDAHLTANYCGFLGTNGQPITSSDCIGPGHTTPKTPQSPDGYPLPYDSLWKGFLSARYSFPFVNGTAFVEGDQNYQSAMWTNQLPKYNLYYGPPGCVGSGCQVPAYGLTNFSLGLDKNNWEVELLIKNVFNRDAVTNFAAELERGAEYADNYSIVAPPRLIGLQFTQNF